MNRAVIALGSNIDADRKVPDAIEAISRDLRLIAQSQIMQTRPIGGLDQPDYSNSAVLVETALSREELVGYLRNIETKLGRLRTHDKNAPRTIDLDIVVWNGLVVDEDVHTRDYLRQLVIELLGELP